MYLRSLLAVLGASSCILVSAKIPISVYTSRAIPPGPGLRLIKTSEQDPGRWMTDEEKLDYVGKHIHFIDITDIEVCGSSEEFRSLGESARLKSQCRILKFFDFYQLHKMTTSRLSLAQLRIQPA